MFNFQNSTEQDPSLMTPLAKQLIQDDQADIKNAYFEAFEALQIQAAKNLRQPMSPQEFEINQAAFDVANVATEVLTRFWDRYHTR